VIGERFRVSPLGDCASLSFKEDLAQPECASVTRSELELPLALRPDRPLMAVRVDMCRRVLLVRWRATPA